jgi:glutathione S-transferase
MKLFGSLTSPYVRRIRVLLEKVPHEFELVHFFDEKDRKAYIDVTPVLKIPFLEIDGEYIYDSRVIFNQLQKRGFHPALNLEKENLLTIIDGLADSLIQILLAKRSNVTFPPNTPLEVSHFGRAKSSLPYLEKAVIAGKFKEWDYPTICLFTTIDWILFRELADLSPYPGLLSFRESHLQRPIAQQTNPRNA